MWYLPMGGYLRAVKIVFGIIAALSVLALISDVLEIRLYGKVIAGDDVSDQQLDFNDIRVAIVGMLQFLALIGGAITFILWLYRAYQNTDAVSPGTRRYGRGWAIGGWFVPVLAWWRPKQVINDVWRAGGQSEPSGLLAAWWTMWVIAATGDRIGGRMVMNAETPDAYRDAAIAYVVIDLLFAVSAILAIKVASVLTSRLDERAKLGPPQQTQRFERHEEQETSWFPQAGEGPPPPPKFGSGQPYPAAR
jgi:hypothetical protein